MDWALLFLHGGEGVLRSCSYCGRIHDPRDVCAQKLARHREYWKYDPMNRTQAQRFRATSAWKKKSEEIRARDNYCCQACLRKLKGTRRRLEYENVSVHHVISLDEDFSRRLDNDNLITLCSVHHELAESGKMDFSEIQTIIWEQEQKNIPPGTL
jgi:5-methylcytosine-specific restriction endonuclease McrA